MNFYKNIITKEVREFETNNGRIITTIKIAGRWVSNPTITDFENEGWQEYTPPEPQEEEVDYPRKVVRLIRLKYTIDDELAIQRQRDTKPEEFEKYNTYIEWCKKEAKKEEKKKKSGE